MDLILRLFILKWNDNFTNNNGNIGVLKDIINIRDIKNKSGVLNTDQVEQIIHEMCVQFCTSFSLSNQCTCAYIRHFLNVQIQILYINRTYFDTDSYDSIYLFETIERDLSKSVCYMGRGYKEYHL